MVSLAHVCADLTHVVMKRAKDSPLRPLVWVAIFLIYPAYTPAIAQQPAKVQARAEGILPHADHLAHLPSPAVQLHRMKPAAPAIALPADLAELLRRRANIAGSPRPLLSRTDVSDLYADDAAIIHHDFNNWVRGRAEASNATSLYAEFQFGEKPYELVPVAYDVSESAGYIVGFFTQMDSASPRIVGEFHLSLKKNKSGKWVIGAESEHFPGPATPDIVSVEDLIRNLNDGGIRKAVVTSLAFWWGSALLDRVPNERERVRQENEWLVSQVARYPDRLVAFCSFNPLKEYALDEVEWCARTPLVKGIKLHIADAGTDLYNPRHIAQLRKVFRAANEHRLPIAAHVATQEMAYGRDQARIYLDSIFTAAPDIAIQMTHLAGHGPAHGGDALAFFAAAAQAHDPRMKNVYFDVSSNVWDWTSQADLKEIATRLRQIGLDHILFATDWPAPGRDFTEKTAWSAFRRLPLSDAEFARIARNTMPWAR